MIGRRLTVDVFLLAAASVLVVVAVAWALAGRIVYIHGHRQAVVDLQADATLLARSIEGDADPSERLGRLADGWPDAIRAEVTSEAATPSRANSDDVVAFAPIPGFENRHVRLTLPGAILRARTDRIARGLRIAVIVAGIVALAGAFIVLPRLDRPLETTATFAERVADGDWNATPPPIIEADLETIVTSVGALAAELRGQVATRAHGRKSLATIIDSMVEGVIAVDREEQIVLVNDVARRVFHIAATASEVDAVEALRRHPDLIDKLRFTMERNVPQTVEIEVSNGVGDRVLDAIVSPLLDRQKDVSGAVAVLHDVSEMRRVEQIRRDFVANVSHELKTPLTAIRGSADTVMGDENMPREFVTRFVGKIQHQADRLEALIGDVLELSRIQSGAKQLLVEPVDLVAATRDSIGRLTETAREKDISLTTTTEREQLLVPSDRQAMLSILDNLLSNGIRYTPSGGRIEVKLSTADGYAVVEVVDNGIGMAAEHLDRIFERFYRVDPARSRAAGGTGLGLAIVRNAVVAHGGTIAVTSAVDEGTSFLLRLPLRRPTT